MALMSSRHKGAWNGLLLGQLLLRGQRAFMEGRVQDSDRNLAKYGVNQRNRNTGDTAGRCYDFVERRNKRLQRPNTREIPKLCCSP